jgi:peptidoglycan hydrolase CwlO-like protein
MSSTFPARGARTRIARWAILVVLALVVGLLSVGSASGDTASRLASARARLRHLGDQIKSEQAQVSSLRGELASLNVKIDAEQTRLGKLNAEVQQTRTQLETARAEYQATRARIDDMARTVYMQGPGTSLEVILGATSFSNLMDRVQFVSDVGQQEADLGQELQVIESLLRSRSQHLGVIVAQQKTLLAQLTQQRQSKATAVAAQEAALQQLDSTRTQIVQLIGRLQRQLRREELASIGRIFQGGHNATYGNWAGVFLQTMSAPSCHSNMVAVVAWQVAEFTQADWNPLATTYPMAGSTLFNSAGVRNYASLAQGLQATKLTIQAGLGSHGYGGIVSGLSGCADPMTTARAINASDWCGGCAGGGYVIDMVPKVEANYDTYAAL